MKLQPGERICKNRMFASILTFR